MKKFLLLLLVPIFLFSQDREEYKNTKSLSQFVEELKYAANEGLGYSLEDCHVTYSNSDYKYLSYNNSKAVIDESLDFNKNSLVSFKNCKFGGRVSSETRNDLGWENKLGVFSSVLEFKNADFGDLIFHNISADIKLDSITAQIGISYEITNGKPHTLAISRSDINGVYLNLHEEDKNVNSDYEIKIETSKINFCIARDIKNFLFKKNHIYSLIIKGIFAKVQVQHNNFNVGFEYCQGVFLLNNLKPKFANFYGFEIGRDKIKSEINELDLSDNIFHSVAEPISNDSLLNILESYDVAKNKYHLKWTEKTINLVWLNKKEKKKWNLWSDRKRLDFFIQHIRKNDTLKISYNRVARISISHAEFEKLTISSNIIKDCYVFKNRINTNLEITKTFTDSLMYFYKNIIPDKHNITIDKSPIYNLGFLYPGGRYYYGDEDYSLVKERLKEERFKESFLDLSAQYRQFIAIYHENGSDFKADAVIALKDFQTKKKMYKYYQNSDIINLLNWRGGQFLGIYCDYGLNPFKALKYCFYVMLIFSIFYFFFYSDWDKIDRAFLIKKFSNIVDYFSSEKRIQDFYTDSHNAEMKTFLDFKLLLELNRVHTPFFLYLIAKPLYKLSLLRYKFLNYLYNKAEFMAGKRWGDLNIKERYAIGFITMILLFLYIIYLIFIRVLNSVILSLNAFSTLGFGQIPVRGFTKYITIIEGFVGWFLLGVFIVSLLNQMSNI